MRKNVLLSFLLALVIEVTLILPAQNPVYAAGNSTTIDVSDTSNIPASVTYNSGVFTINNNSVSSITLTGTDSNTIAVATGVTGLTLILNNLSITNPLSGRPPIDLQGTADVTIQLASGTVNTLNASTNDTLAGLCVPSTATVTINGTGSLTATGGKWGAGIGGGSGVAGGTINISSGTVTATGGLRGAGIGGGNTRSGGTVNISGGTVTAKGGQNGAGIGGGITGAGGTVNISGGTVTATGGQGGAGIGGGSMGGSGIVNIIGTPTVMAASDSSRPAIDASSGSGNVINATLNNTISTNPTYLKCNGNELTFPGSYKNFAFSAAADSAVSAYSEPTYTTLLGIIMTNPAGIASIPVTNPTVVTPVMINIATIAVNKDGLPWTTGTPTIQLSTSNTALQGVVSGTGSNGVYTFTGIDPATTYYVWDTTNYTNQSVTITSSNATVNYYTVQFAVTNAGTASGSTKAATYNSSAINTGDVVLGGKQLVITAAGAGASSYTYAWSGTGTSGQTTAALTIATLSSSINATCTVTGAPASTTINVGDSSGTNLPTGVIYASSLFTVGTGANNRTITVTGITTTNTIAVASGVSGLTLILNNVSITSPSMGNSPIDLQDGASVIIQLAGGTTNVLNASSSNLKAGLWVQSTATVTINGTGTLNATSGGTGAGIGGSNGSAVGTINISSGTVTAISSSGGNSAGIGGSAAAGGTIHISGGTVTAIGNNGGAGIGGGNTGTGGNITIDGGTVNAISGNAGAGIGGGNNGAGGNITISGGIVNATGTCGGAGIGGGTGGAGGTINIGGNANITAKCILGSGAGIGGGNNGAGGNITISGGIVNATGDYTAAGIGGGQSGVSGTININGSPNIMAASNGIGKPAIDAAGGSGSVINAKLNAAISASDIYLKYNSNVLRLPASYKCFAFSSAAASAVSAYSDSGCTALLGSIVTNPANVVSIPVTDLNTNPTNITAVKLYTVSATVLKDGTAWITGIPAIQLSTSNASLTGAVTGSLSTDTYTFTGLDASQTYYVWDTTNSQYTGQSVTSSSTSVAVNYYTVTLAIGSGIGSTTGGGTYLSSSTNVQINAAVIANYTWSKWTQTIGGTDVSTTQNFTIPTVTSKISYTANATPNGPVPMILTSSLSNGTVGTPYSQTLSAASVGAVTWSMTGGGTLPNGLTLNSSTGVISGMPNVAGAFSFTVQATNSNGSTTKALSITVDTPIPYTATITVKKDDSAWTSGTPPMQLSTSNALLTGAVTGSLSTGTYTFTGLDASQTYYVWDTTNSQYTSQSVTSLSTSAAVNYYTVTLSAGAGISSTTGSGTYLTGSNVSIDAAVSSGYTWSKWTQSSGGVDVSATKNYQITPIAAQLRFTANATSPLASFTPVALTQTGDVAHSNVQYTTAAAVIAALPTTISVTLVNSSAVNVPITWVDTDHYNAGAAAAYTFTAAWGAMPAGANNNNNLAVPTVEVAVAAGVVAAQPSTPSIIVTQPSVPSTPASSSVDIIVNGDTINAGTASNSNEGGKTVTTITADQQKLEQKLTTESNNAIVIIPIDSASDKLIGQLNGQMVKNMENKQATLEVRTKSATYTLPASEINIDAVSAQLGTDVTLSNIIVQVAIASPSDQTVTTVKSAAENGGFSVVVHPVDFGISCTYGSKTVDVSTFNAYVERTVAIPDGVDPAKITTGIVVNPDGTVHHVPTKVTVINGKYYAVINSLTNSTYTVIWNPIQFSDVTTNWARDAINDMGSRMVIAGVGGNNYAPDRDITRAEFAAIVVRALGLKPGTGNNLFTDVSSTKWYCDFIKTATEYKIILGYGNGKFGPMDKITREQAMSMLARAMKITGLKVDMQLVDIKQLFTKFGIKGTPAECAKNDIALCIKAGIVLNIDGQMIKMKENITRAEVAVIVRRLLQKSNLI